MATALVSPESIVARIERLPVSAWHVRMRIIISSATFFDAFDAVTIAFIIPALIGAWHIRGEQIGFLVASGYVGQAIGAIGAGWIAERYGRLRVLAWTVAWIAVLSLACAFAWDYWSLLVLRFIQGLALGGEVPIALTYVNEFAKAEKRGQFVLIFQSIFPVGIVATSALSIWIVPHLGWQWMFVLGALPAILAAVLRRLLPESPRWLASRGRLAEADRVLSAIEAEISENGRKPLPPPIAAPRVAELPPRWGELFEGIYRARTFVIWTLWFIAAFVGYGLTIWLPTIYRTVYKLPIQQSLQLALISNVALVVSTLAITFLLDRTGRRGGFVGAFTLAAIPLLILWALGAGTPVINVVVLATLAGFFASTMQLTMVLYASELYPTRIRALGGGVGSAWTRLGTIIGPPIIGLTLQHADVAAVFLLLGLAAFAGAITMLLFGEETTGKVLEELSP